MNEMSELSPSSSDLSNDESLLSRLSSLSANELETLVRHHNRAYWEQNTPEISDFAYDKLVEALRVARPDAAVLNELGESPGGQSERRFGSVTHERPMLSLDKCYDDETLARWAEKIQGGYFITPKIDGLACSIRYDASGALQVCATRGDGKVGDDITQNAALLHNIPRQLAERPGHPVEVRGEVYLSLKRFREHYADQFANPRNLAAGALKQKDPARSAEYGLSFFAYDLLGARVQTEREKQSLARTYGFDVPPGEFVSEARDLPAAFRRIDEARDSLDYETDGVVMKADDVREHDRMGLTAHHPRYAIAYKFQGEGAQTRLRAVEWSVGRSGVITPVAVVDPVFVSGVTVTRASLHNAGYVEKLGLRQDARVELVRRGGVIPHVERVLSADGESIPRPVTCPCCQGPTRIEGDFVYCANPKECPDVIRGRISHFTNVIDVLGFGKKHLSQMVERGMVRAPADLFRLTPGALGQLERMGPTLAQKLLNEISARRRLPLPVFLTALGIDEIGPTVAETLCAVYPSWDALQQATEEDLSNIHGVGPSIAKSLVDGLQTLSEEITDLLGEIELLAAPEPVTSDHPLSGKSVVFTGKMARMDRKEAQKKVRELGGKTPSGVSRELDFLVVGDDGSPLLGDGKKSTKQVSAEKHIANGASIRLISESEFAAIIEGKS